MLDPWDILNLQKPGTKKVEFGWEGGLALGLGTHGKGFQGLGFTAGYGTTVAALLHFPKVST